MDQELQVQGSE